MPIHLSTVVIMREIKEQGYEGGITRLRQHLVQLRGSQVVPDTVRFETAAVNKCRLTGVRCLGVKIPFMVLSMKITYYLNP
jgi:transposase